MSTRNERVCAAGMCGDGLVCKRISLNGILRCIHEHYVNQIKPSDNVVRAHRLSRLFPQRTERNLLRCEFFRFFHRTCTLLYDSMRIMNQEPNVRPKRHRSLVNKFYEIDRVSISDAPNNIKNEEVLRNNNNNPTEHYINQNIIILLIPTAKQRAVNRIPDYRRHATQGHCCH